MSQMIILSLGSEPGGIRLEKLGGVVRPASQNPYPIYDQNLRYYLPYLRPDQKFEILLKYREHNLWRASVDFFFDNNAKVASS